MNKKINRLTICLLMTASFSGCVYTSLPDLPAPPVAAEQCQELPMPDAVPETVHLVIDNGHVVNVDAGGEKMLRDYVGLRKTIKRLWHE
jgi:hypothetical protein